MGPRSCADVVFAMLMLMLVLNLMLLLVVGDASDDMLVMIPGLFLKRIQI